MLSAPLAANAIQSSGPPSPFVSVTVTGVPGGTAVALTASIGPATVSVTALDVPPPGAGVTTVIACGPLVVKSLGDRVAISCVADSYVVGRAAPLLGHFGHVV